MEFRFPKYGDFAARGVEIELRQALEPWHVMGEEGVVGATTRYVDSSLERVQVKATGLAPDRYVLACNGRPIPLQATGTARRVRRRRTLPGLAAGVGAASDDRRPLAPHL